MNVQLEDTVSHNLPLDDDELLILARVEGLTATLTALLKLCQNKIMCHSFFLFFISFFFLPHSIISNSRNGSECDSA